MDYKLTDQIISLIATLNEGEREAFIKQAKGNPNYLEVYYIIVKHLNDEDPKTQIEQDIFGLKFSINDAKENLRDKLVDHVRSEEQKTNLEQLEIIKSIDTITALIKRNQTELAIDILHKTYKKIKRITPDGTNYHLFIQYLNLVLLIQTKRYDAVTRNLPEDFESKDVIDWLNRLTKAAVSYLTPTKEIVHEKFSSNLFFYCLVDYLRKKEFYEDLDSLFASDDGSDIFRGLDNSNDKTTIGTFKILKDLYKLDLAIKLNRFENVKYLLHSLENHSFDLKEKNYQTFIFLMIQFWEFRINVGLDTNNFEIFTNTKNILELNKGDLNLFTDKELNSVALRIEMNKGLVAIFSKKYEDAYKQFSSIPLTEKMNMELKYYIKLFEALSYRMCFTSIDLGKFDKSLEFIKNIKYVGTEYSKVFYKLLLKNSDGKNLIKEGAEFQKLHCPNNLFEKVCHAWLGLISVN